MVPAAEVSAMTLLGATAIVPVAVFVPPVHPPVMVTVYVNDPLTDGVPEMVKTLDAHVPVTPAGNPATVAPVAPVVEYIIFVMVVLMQGACALVPAAEVSEIVLASVELILN